MPVTVSFRRCVAAIAAVAALTSAALPAAAVPAAPGSSGATTAPGGPLPIAVVVPLAVPPESPALLDVDALIEYTAPGGLLDRQLDAVEAWPVTLAIDPRIPASIRVLGSAVPDAVADWLARLETLPHERFALAYADADLASLAAVDAAELGSPLSFQHAIDPARFGPAVETSPAPAPTPAPAPEETSPAPEPSHLTPAPVEDEPSGPPPLPDDEALVSIDADLEAIVWPAAGSVAEDALEPLQALGIETLLLDSGQVEGGEDAPHVRLGALDALVADARLSALASTAAFSAGIAESGEASAELFDSLAERATGSTRPVVIALDRRTTSVPSRVGSVLAGIAGVADARFGTLAEVAAVPAVTATLTATTAEAAERREAIADLAAAATAESRFASVTADPGAFRSERRLDLLAVASTGWHVRPVGWVDAVDAFLERSREIRSSVQIAQGSDLLVLSPNAGLPVPITNALDVPVTVVVSARPLRPLLRVPGGAVEVTVEPGSSHTAYLPAEAVTTGKVAVQLTMRSPTGVEIGAPAIVHVDLQPQWETVGVLILIGLAIVFFLGIVRNVVRRRRAAGKPQT